MIQSTDTSWIIIVQYLRINTMIYLRNIMENRLYSIFFYKLVYFGHVPANLYNYNTCERFEQITTLLNILVNIYCQLGILFFFFLKSAISPREFFSFRIPIPLNMIRYLENFLFLIKISFPSASSYRDFNAL